jgi:tRNA dimethylallyltransferase
VTDGVPKTVLIVGPTAGGKTALSVELARTLPHGGEVISADAFLVYRGMDIGTAKPTADERRGVPHHLIDIREPTERFSVHAWLTEAEAAIDGVRARGRTPIVVGGTHLYAKALLDGLFEGPKPDPALRAELVAMGLPALRAELERVDPAAATRIHPNDERRTVRALEVFRQTGMPMTEHQTQWDGQDGRRDIVLVGLEWPTEAINGRINARVRAMMAGGFLDEVRGLVERGVLGPQAREALGYKQLAEHLSGACSLDDAVERIKIQTRRFAKNQRTWLRRLRTTPGSVWLGPEAVLEPVEAAGRIAAQVMGS